MGQYHVIVNLDKREFIHPHRVGDGLKAKEFGYSAGGAMTGLAILLTVSNGRGGGDFNSESDIVGRWGGDRLAIVGDYAEDGDLAPEFKAESIYGQCGEPGGYRDISAEVRKAIEEDGMYRFEDKTEGWIARSEVSQYRYVRSDRSGDTYIVRSWTDGSVTCTCPGFAFRKRCKHQSVVATPEKSAVGSARLVPDMVVFGS